MELIFERLDNRVNISMKYKEKTLTIGTIMRSQKDNECYCYFSDSCVGSITLSVSELKQIAKELDKFEKRVKN